MILPYHGGCKEKNIWYNTGKKERKKMKMRFEFDTDEVSVLLVSLIRRRINVKDLIGIVETPESVQAYTKELAIVESMLDKVIPGCVESIKKTENVA